MKIAILGWGSLLWDKENSVEFDQWRNSWGYDGPILKLEFSRISESHLGALTLVIDDEHGNPVTVAWCLSKRTRLEDAVCDLRCREGTTVGNIGRLDLASLADRSNNDTAENSILTWARLKKLDAVVWTALQSNFKKKTNEPFSVAAAVSHLKGLGSDGKAKAAEYVWRAPDFVKTRLRTALQKEPWFLEIGH